MLGLVMALWLIGAGVGFGGTTTNLLNVDIGAGPVQSGAAILGSVGNTWNAFGPGTASTVVNSANSILSGVSVTVDPGATSYNTASPTVDAATASLMKDFVYRVPGGPAVPVTINGLGNSINQPFTLVVYAGMDPGQPCTINITAGATGGNTTNTLNTTSATRKLSDGLGVAYNTFTGTLTNGTLTFAVGGSSYHGPNGFQLLLISPNPAITNQPVTQSAMAGNPVSFSVGATGTAPFSYQWQATNNLNGFTNLGNAGPVSGATSNVLTISPVTPNWALTYRVIVTNSVGAVTSAPASLTVQTFPVITTQPVSQTTIAGSSVAFSVAGTGGVPLSYQWQATNGGTGTFTNLAEGGQISGTTSNVLALAGITTNQIQAYRVILTNNYGAVTSVVANLTVLSFVNPPNVPDPGAMGPALAANVRGTYTAPPANLVSSKVTGGLVTGNGDMAITVGGPSSALKFYVGKADFFGVLRGAIMPVGSLTLSAPALNGSSYLLNQNVGPATVTGAFANGNSSLSVTSWVASAENTTVIQLNNTGSQPLTLTSQLLDGFAGSAGNPATYGSTNNSTWLNVSPDTVYVELGNQLHNAFGTAPFTGKIADLRVFNQALSGPTLAALDNVGAPTPLLRWATTNMGTATLVGNASLNGGDPHGGSVSVSGGADEVAVGDLPLPENQFTFSTWINVASTGVNGNIMTAQIPYPNMFGSTFPYPYTRGLTLRLSGGKLSASMNQSGYLDLNSTYQTFAADGANAFTTTAGSQVPVNQWIQTAVTYDGNTLRIFTNGVQAGVPITFPTGLTNGMMGWNKMVTHVGDTNVLYNGCAPQGVLMQSVVGTTATESSQGALTFTIPAGGQVSIALAAVTDRNNTNYFAAAQQQSQQATASSLSNLYLAHAAWWSNFWAKSFVQIPNQRVQDNWYAQLYLLACCSTSNSPPPGLWGNFNTTTTPEWLGDYTLDYNYQAPFWGAMACNHHELVENYDKVLLDQMSRGRATAQYAFPGNNGIYFYTHFIPAPGWSDDPGTFWGQKSLSLFCAVNSVMRWKYTADTNYAAKIYPFLKGTADFWDKYLVDTGGNYVVYHDSAWELSGDDTNPSTTLAFIQMVYPALVKISEQMNVDADRRAKWNDIIARLAPQTIVPASSIGSLNGLGAPYNNPGVNVIRASSSGADFPIPCVTVYQDHAKRHSSAGMGPCQVIYPAWNIGLESDPAMFLAASNTMWLAAQWYDNNNSCNFYPGAACVGYNPVEILANLETLIGAYTYQNFLMDLDGGGTEDYSIVPGTLAAMFVQSYQTNLHVFPTWPTNQSATFGNMNACGGFLVSGAITLGTPNYVQIQSSAGQMLKLANPWPGTTVQCVSSVTGTNTLSGTVLNYQTQVGEVLTLTTISAVSLAAPANLTAVTNGNLVVLNWSAVPGAAGYNVKRASAVGGPYLNLVSGITATNYTDTSAGYATTYYYTVTALAPGFESPAAPAVAVSLPPAPPVANWSFENPTVANGGYTLSLPGWSTAGNAAAFAIINPGAGSWPSATPAGLDGANAGQIFMTAAGQSGIFYQDTGIKYVAGLTYQLTAAIGLQLNQTFDTNSALVFYNSGLTVLASKVITPTNLVAGAFTDVTVSYTATGAEGGNGNVVVGLSAPPAAVGQSYFDFDNVRLTVLSTNPPVITVPPVAQTNTVGSTAAFSITATGAGPLSYQWQAGPAGGPYTNLVTSGNLAGATSNVLTISGVTTNWALAYQVIVSNGGGAVTSAPPATLTVVPVPPPMTVLVNIDFGASATQTGAAVLGASNDVWNAVTGNTGTLRNAAGNILSGVGLTLGSQGIFNNIGGLAMDPATTPLMQEYAFGGNGPGAVTVNLTGLGTYTNYGLTMVVYGAGDTAGQGTAFTLTGATGGNSSGPVTTSASSRKLSLGSGVAYNVFTGTLTNGTLSLAATANGSAYTIVNGLQLQLVPPVVVATNAPALTWQMNGNQVQFNWPGDHVGWRLLAQTNNLMLGLSSDPNDWATLPGSAATNTVSINLNSTNPAGFYRLVYP